MKPKVDIRCRTCNNTVEINLEDLEWNLTNTICAPCGKKQQVGVFTRVWTPYNFIPLDEWNDVRRQ